MRTQESVPTLDSVRIVVTIADADPPEGQLTTSEDANPTAFVGWLGLIRLLADAVGSDPVRDDQTPEPGGSSTAPETAEGTLGGARPTLRYPQRRFTPRGYDD